jgi:hypothetical protein
VLIGPPGSGKSTLLLWLQQQVVACRREHILGHGQALPVLIRLRELGGFSTETLSDSRRLVEVASGSRDLADLMPDGWLDRQFAEGTVLLLLDGLDETEPSVRDGVLLPWLARLLNAHPTWRTVITSRPAGFPEAAFTGSQSDSSEVTFKQWHPALYALQDFGPEEVAAYLRNWSIQVRIAQNESVPEATSRGCEEAEAIAASVRSHPAVKDLARTPLLLSAICLVYRFEGGKLPEDRAALYRLCVEGLLDRWEAQKGLTSPFTADLKLRVCKELAASMMKARTAECPYEVARCVAADVLGNVELAGALLGHVLNRAGLLTERTPGVLSFAHLTFQEYLAALAIRDENRQGLSVATLAEELGDMWWLEVILLYGRIAPPPLVRQLFSAFFAARPRFHGVGHDESKLLTRFEILLSAYQTTSPEIRDTPDFRRELLCHLLASPIQNAVGFHDLNILLSTFRGKRDPLKVFAFTEIAEAIRSGNGLGEIEHPRPRFWTWATFWLFGNPTYWNPDFDRHVLDNWRNYPPSAVRQSICRYYGLSPLEELAQFGIRPELWRARLSDDPRFAGILQAEAAMAGLSGRVLLLSRRGGQEVNLTDLIPEHLFLDLVECCCESKWTEFRRPPYHYYLFSFFQFEPSTPAMRQRAITAFSKLAESLGTYTPTLSLHTWLKTASAPRT